MKRFLTTIFTTAALIAPAIMCAAEGPTSALYLTEPSDLTLVRVQGDEVAAEPMHAQEDEAPIVVNGRIRTLGDENGAEYDLDLQFTGRTFPRVRDTRFFDATTDGVYIYVVEFGTGHLSRYDLNWSNPRSMFTAEGADHWLGITYDPANDSLWLAEYSDTQSHIFQYDRFGNLLSSFNSEIPLVTGLALDHADGTLWFFSHMSPGVLYPMSKAGEHLGPISVPGFDGIADGAEFDLGAAAKVKDIRVPRGRLLEGDRRSLRTDDADVLRMRAESGPGGLTRVVCDIKFKTRVLDGSGMDILIEGYTDVPAGAKILVRNRRTGRWDQVKAYQISDDSGRVIASNLNPRKYVSDEGRITVRLCQIAVDASDPRWVSYLSVMQVRVR